MERSNTLEALYLLGPTPTPTPATTPNLVSERFWSLVSGESVLSLVCWKEPEVCG